MVPNPTKDEIIPEDNEAPRPPKLVAPQADPSWQYSISWKDLALLGYWHAAAVYGLYLCFTSAHWATIFHTAILLEASLLGVMSGAHRLWCHKSYKVKLPLEIILLVFQTMSGQFSVFQWVQNHRLHHRHSDTDADPHNAARGFFFSQIGWELVHEHPEVRKRRNSTDVSDITSNPVLAFQKKYWVTLFILACFVIPTGIPIFFWGETFTNAWHLNILRFMLSLNFTGLINSAAHKYGSRPYDKGIQSTQNTTVTILTLGEGFHNYHHAFPWDYAAGELGEWFNFSKTFIDFFAWIGWAYDLKSVDKNTMIKRIEKSGDGSYTWETRGRDR